MSWYILLDDIFGLNVRTSSDIVSFSICIPFLLYSILYFSSQRYSSFLSFYSSSKFSLILHATSHLSNYVTFEHRQISLFVLHLFLYRLILSSRISQQRHISWWRRLSAWWLLYQTVILSSSLSFSRFFFLMLFRYSITCWSFKLFALSHLLLGNLQECSELTCWVDLFSWPT